MVALREEWPSARTVNRISKMASRNQAEYRLAQGDARYFRSCKVKKWGRWCNASCHLPLLCVKWGMSLKVNLRHLEEHGLHLKGDLPVKELDLGLRDEVIRVEKPLRYDLQVEQLEHSVLVRGRLEITLDCECVRCLKSFEETLELPDWTLHLPLEGEEKTAVDNDCIDLTPFAREDMLLEFPQHPLCSPECSGLSKNGRGHGETSPSAWKKLDKLNL
jgi:uncharacterized metal-binding protein YceD (DUF177 family)